jgi:hypothetical protein
MMRLVIRKAKVALTGPKSVVALAAYVVMTLLISVFALADCGPGAGPKPGYASKIKLYNCTHVSGPSEPPSGRAFNVYTRVDGGAWVLQGGLNPQPGDWSDCHDAAHEAGSMLTWGILDPAGKWEIRAIMLPRSDEPSCDSSAPDVRNACGFIMRVLQTDITAGLVTIDLSDSEG